MRVHTKCTQRKQLAVSADPADPAGDQLINREGTGTGPTGRSWAPSPRGPGGTVWRWQNEDRFCSTQKVGLQRVWVIPETGLAACQRPRAGEYTVNLVPLSSSSEIQVRMLWIPPSD